MLLTLRLAGRAEALLIAAYGQGLKMKSDLSCISEQLESVPDEEQGVPFSSTFPYPALSEDGPSSKIQHWNHVMAPTQL